MRYVNMSDEKHTEGCMLCGGELVYSEKPRSMVCAYCGRSIESECACKFGHYVCDECHARDALGIIETACLSSHTCNPFEIADAVMSHPRITMHGPEHHALVAGALVASYRNKMGKATDEDVKEAIRRGSNVPGGYCGFSGACGAAIGLGIAVAVVTKSTPIAREPWKQANNATSCALSTIAEHGGPRCCKRNVWLALEKALSETMFKGLEIYKKRPVCKYMSRNKECRKKACPFFPKKAF